MKATMYQSSALTREFMKETTLAYGEGYTDCEGGVVNVFDEIEYQEILGIGAAFTESAAYNYAQLTDEQKQDFLTKYFDREKGIGYNFGRTHINSCDFSLDIYTYVEDGDKTLATFNIDRDRKYIIPFLKDVLAYCKEELILFASPWSPPAYMKENESPIQGGRLKEEYKKVWALYYAKYIKAYREEGIHIGAISVQNEPKARQTWESCYYDADDEREFLKNYLIPTLEEEGLGDLKIIIWDHNKERVYDRARDVLKDPVVNDRVWAVGHHWYSGDHFDGLTLVHEQLHKPTICTEFCGGINDDPVYIAERYARAMCRHFNHYTCASCDWNILLSHLGGPYHNRTAESVSVAGKVFESKAGGCHAPVLYNTETKELLYTPTYYYIGHYSKFIQRGAKRIAVTYFDDDFPCCAFKNPDGKIVVVMLNLYDRKLGATLRHEGKATTVPLAPHSIATVVLEK